MSKPTHVTANRISNSVLRSPVLWGILGALAFYIAVHTGHIRHGLVVRYFASHPVEYIATTMFFVGLAALLIKLLDIVSEPTATAETLIGPMPAEGQTTADCPALLNRLQTAPAGGRLAARLQHAIGYVQRTRSAQGLEDHLRHLAETDEARSQGNYALVRIVISTIPILGFLGTVIGITRAVAELAQVVGAMSFEQAINSVVSGLSVAFDTTALALALSIVLMFTMFMINRWESRRLMDVETEAGAALIGRFITTDANHDAPLAAVRHMTDEIVRKTDHLVHRQAEIWQQTIDAAGQRWNTMAVTAEKQLETALGRALQSSLASHGQQLAAAERAAEERVGRYWQEMLGMLDQTASTLSAQYDELRKQGEVMARAVEATERVIKLEDALNHNLGALRDTNQFDQTVNSLAATISLLNARLGRAADVNHEIGLQPPAPSGHAA